jgi:hypothetical protein
MWYPSWYKKSSSTKGKMEIPAPGKGNKRENDARSTARGTDYDDDDDSSCFTINTLPLNYKD